MSQDNSQSGTRKTTIKIAAKEASQRNSAGGADPGPGDINAAPSVAPQLVDIPDPPTASQLVVKSTAIPTLHEGRSDTLPSASKGPKSIVQSSLSGAGAGGSSKHHHSGSKHHHSGSKHHHSQHSMQGSQLGPAASQPSAAREPTSSKTLTGVPESSVGGKAGEFADADDEVDNAAKSVSAPKSVSGPKSGTDLKSATGPKSVVEPKSTTGLKSGTSPKSTTGPKSSTGPKSATSPAGAESFQPSSPATASQAMQADSGVVHDEVEEGEGELMNPEASPSPAASPKSSGSTAASSPASSVAGGTSSSKMSTRAKSAGAASGASGASSAKDSGFNDKTSTSTAIGGKAAKNKVTKFRYHKRITVRTHGKTSPKAIMEKVNKKDHQAGITPSTIEDMDPAELMKRAGIKGNKNTHWRVRLRQTKRLTKNGKTTTETKVAYRDSEGNKRVKTSSNPYCKNCGKMLEQCKCDAQSQS